jgi:hemoglobin
MTHSHPSHDPTLPDDATSAAERRARVAQRMREETGIDESMIEQLVHRFYARIRADEMLGPIFNERVQDWDKHLKRMCEFWSSVMLATGVYQGTPMRMHLPLPVDARHFDHWLALFEDTARGLFGERIAALFMERARRIAFSLEVGIAGTHGVLLGKHERFYRPD